MIRGMVVTLVGTAAFKAVCGAVKVLAGFDSQTFPPSKVNGSPKILQHDLSNEIAPFQSVESVREPRS